MKSKTPKISIIVPIYNTEKYIDRCIDSILKQTYRNFELLLVNDGSIDASAAICDEFARKDPRIIIMHQENLGVSAARNKGLEICTGDYITFVDSDDWVHYQLLEILLQQLIKNNADVSFCDEYKTKNMIVDASSELPLNVSIYNHLDMLFVYLAHNKVADYCHTRLYKKALLKNTRFNDTYNMLEDSLFCYQVFKKCNKVVHVNAKLYYYFFNPCSATNTMNREKYVSAMSVLNNICEDIKTFYPKFTVASSQKRFVFQLMYYGAVSIIEDVEKDEYEKFSFSLWKHLDWLIKDRVFTVSYKMRLLISLFPYSIHVKIKNGLLFIKESMLK